MGASVARPALDRGRRVRTRWTEAVVHTDQLRRSAPMRAACLGGTGEQQEDYWRSRHPGSGPPVLWAPGSPGCERPPEELLHKRGQRGSCSRSGSRRTTRHRLETNCRRSRETGCRDGVESSHGTRGPVHRLSRRRPRRPVDEGASVAGKSHAGQLLCVTPLQENNRRPSEKAGCAVSPTGPKWRLLW